jgi:hypothetical protein
MNKHNRRAFFGTAAATLMTSEILTMGVTQANTAGLPGLAIKQIKAGVLASKV